MGRFRLVVAVLLLGGLAAAPGDVLAQGWQKYVATDRSFSFHYPAGWKVNAQESGVEVDNAATHEQLLIVAIPFDPQKSPRALANVMVAAFKQGIPDLQASAWRAEADQVYFQLAYTKNGTRYSGDVLVVKAKQSAHWFSYSAPYSGYGRKEAVTLLQAVVGSVTAGAGSQTPAGAPPGPQAGTPGAAREAGHAPASADRISANAHAVLWVMEFALGAPLSVKQEQAVVGKLRVVWSGKPEAEVAEFDTYPQVMLRILGLGQQNEVEQARKTLADTFRGWFQQSQSADPIVVALRAAFTEKPKVLVPGKPALTETMATSYAELMAFARLLQTNPSGAPEQVPAPAVRELRQQLIDQWDSLSVEDRDHVTTVPGVWICSRTLIRYGNAGDQKATRQRLARLVPASDAAAPSASGRKPMDMVTHNVLLQVNQMTFNTYLWSRGLTTTRFGY